MVSNRCGHFEPRWEHHLYVLCALVILGCLTYIWQESQAYPFSLLEVAVPFALALGLGIYTYRFNVANPSSSESESMTKYGWAGAVFAGVIGTLELAFYASTGLSSNSLPDSFLTFVSLGLVIGVVVGRVASASNPFSNASATNPFSNDSPRDRVLVETSWINRPESSPVIAAIVDALAESENIDPTELDPLYHDINPEIFTHLRTSDGTPCQITVYLEDYEIRANSHGTVTIYQPHPGTPERPPKSPNQR